MLVEPGGEGFAAVLFLAQARDRHDAHRLEARIVAQTLRDFQTIDAGHADVEQDHVGQAAARRYQAGEAVVRDLDLVPAVPQHEAEAQRGVYVVVDHQDPARALRAAQRPGLARARFGVARRLRGHAHGEFTAVRGAFAAGLYRS